MFIDDPKNYCNVKRRILNQSKNLQKSAKASDGIKLHKMLSGMAVLSVVPIKQFPSYLNHQESLF